MKILVLLSVALSLTPACAFDEDWPAEDETGDIGELDREGRVVNGRVINGRLINGRLINGTSFSGYVTGVSLNGVRMPSGAIVNGVVLGSSKFTYGGTTGAGFTGATFNATLSDGKIIPLKITAVRQAATDLWAYKLSYQTDAGWVTYCRDAAGAEVEAYPLNGVWSLSEGAPGGGGRTAPAGMFTFACRVTGAVGKCVDFGYVPWRTVGGTLLQSYHDTCVRAVRADWCGDGRAWTVDGTTINLHDRKLVQTDTDTWAPEAEWSPTGAVCLNKDRVAKGELRGELFPDCAKTRQTATCGTAFTSSNSASLEITERLLQ